MKPEEILFHLACILVLGIGAQWLAWRLRLPSILLLLTFGFLAGPIPQLISRDAVHLQPNAVFGDFLIPLVSVSVAIILFEGGLNLHLKEIKDVFRSVRNLLSIGVVLTWALTALAAHFILGLSIPISLLLGAILVVTGPTVVGPLLQHIRPIGNVASVARWEGIVIDPIGAILAVLVFESTVAAHAPAQWVVAAIGKTILAGGILGFTAAALIVLLLRNYWMPDGLHNPVVLSVVVAAFTLSNYFESESGLVTVTLLGILLANQEYVRIHHIIEFKENITVMLIASLFIMLAARVRPEMFEYLSWSMLLFVAVLVLVIRPASVLLSTLRTRLNLNERLFLSWLAPRGIVAAAVASVFALHLHEQTDEVLRREGQILEAAVFVVIVVTVAVYGLTAAPLARKLGLSVANPQGILFASAHAGARAIAHALQSAGIKVKLVDLNRGNLQMSRLEGLDCHYGSILSAEVVESLDLGGIGRFLAFTSNDQVNSLAAWHMSEIFGRKEVYQLAPGPRGAGPTDMASRHLHGRLLFGPTATYAALDDRFDQGAVVKKTKLTKDFDYLAFLQHYGESAQLMFVITSAGKLQVVTADSAAKPQPGQTIIALVDKTLDSVA